MSYLKSYLKAVLEIACALGIIFLVIGFFMGIRLADYLIYVALVSALAGPISLYLKSVGK